MAHIIQRSLIIVQVSVRTCLYLDQAITCLKSTVPVYSSKRQWPNCMKRVWLSDGKWQYALFHFIYSEPWSLPLTTLCHYSFFLFLSSPVPPLCSLILWSKLGIYVGASAKEQGGITTSVLVWLLEILRLSLFLGLGLSQLKTNTFFAFSDAVVASPSGRKRRSSSFIRHQSNIFIRKHCLHFNAPLAADRLPAAFNGTENLNEGS